MKLYEVFAEDKQAALQAALARQKEFGQLTRSNREHFQKMKTDPEYATAYRAKFAKARADYKRRLETDPETKAEFDLLHDKMGRTK